MKTTPRTFLAIGVTAISTALATGALWAANNPFVGDWKLDPSRSKLTDVMKVEDSPPTGTPLILVSTAPRPS